MLNVQLYKLHITGDVPEIKLLIFQLGNKKSGCTTCDVVLYKVKLSFALMSQLSKDIYCSFRRNGRQVDDFVKNRYIQHSRLKKKSKTN